MRISDWRSYVCPSYLRYFDPAKCMSCATRFATRGVAKIGKTMLGNDTETCVRQGAVLACLGAVDRAASLAEPGATLLLTGGDAGILHVGLGTLWRQHAPLVLEGLPLSAHSPPASTHAPSSFPILYTG